MAPSDEVKRTFFGPRFEEALRYATRLHADQKRKGTDIPYISHLLSVAALVIEDGGDEDEAIAGLLHDAIEDQGGVPTREQIRERFGDRVATIVEGCTDSWETPKRPWRERKESHLAGLSQASPEVLRVSTADKLHNARTLLRDYRLDGEAVWGRFRGGKEGTLWYYRSLTQTLHRSGDNRMVRELEQVVSELEELSVKAR